MLPARIDKALNYIGRSQAPAGSFVGGVSKGEKNFEVFKHHPTTFFTALIMNCLADLTQAESIRKRAANWLLQQKSDSWSWNYWERGDAAANLRTYPDDMDDTACAYIAIKRHSPELIDGEAQANFAKMLISVETMPGGPYRTWLVKADSDPIWKDVDVAVNANICFLLELLGVELDGLKSYFIGKIKNNSLSSPYYTGIEPVLYFLSRCSVNFSSSELATIISSQIGKAIRESNSLTKALLLSSANNLNIHSREVSLLVQSLKSEQEGDGSWPAASLYLEPPHEGARCHAGSSALTTAFCVEALSALSRQDKATEITPSSFYQSKSKSIFESEANDLVGHPSEITSLYKKQLHKLLKYDRDNQIFQMADLVNSALDMQVEEAVTRFLNRGSLAGWAAYTIYDDFLDQEGDPRLLGVANFAMRRTSKNFYSALPGNRDFCLLVSSTLDEVDAANTWEATYARAKIKDKVLKITNKPLWGEYEMLAKKSSGHALAALGVLSALGCGRGSSEICGMSSFFHYYIIARQFCDDAHDWEHDINRGHLTPVVCMLLGDRQELSLELELDQLREKFWEESIDDIALIVQNNIGAAKDALCNVSRLSNSLYFDQWLSSLSKIIEQAITTRDDTRKFLVTLTSS